MVMENYSVDSGKHFLHCPFWISVKRGSFPQLMQSWSWRCNLLVKCLWGRQCSLSWVSKTYWQMSQISVTVNNAVIKHLLWRGVCNLTLEKNHGMDFWFFVRVCTAYCILSSVFSCSPFLVVRYWVCSYSSSDKTRGEWQNPWGIPLG